ncbi:hypothetical protein DFH09DRAFT_1105857 [Mycena vulgaris]|nr:hypothetical protein DFH09DRAFT_1456708 [Mycena vulgaris]KAJ6487534.1 hypothetical protein DFH09DRAFT_1105857 [Mycena vulgaris]
MHPLRFLDELAGRSNFSSSRDRPGLAHQILITVEVVNLPVLEEDRRRSRKGGKNQDRVQGGWLLAGVVVIVCARQSSTLSGGDDFQLYDWSCLCLFFPNRTKQNNLSTRRAAMATSRCSISNNKNRTVAVLWNPKATSSPSTIRDSQAKLDGNALAAFQTLRQEARKALEETRGDVWEEESRPSSPNVEITEVRSLRMPTPTREFLRGVKHKNAHHPGVEVDVSYMFESPSHL